MRLSHLSLLLLAALGTSQGDLAPPERSYKILMLLPASSKSHRNVFMPLAEALADRGHQIVMLTNHNKPSKHPNIREINHGLDDFNTDNMNMFEERKKPAGAFQLFKTALPSLARKLYQLPEVKELFEKRKEFDLIVINHMFNEIIYPFAHEMPFITVATPGMDFRQSAVLGNPLSPAYAPGFHGAKGLDTVFGRLKNLFGHVFMAFYWRIWAIIPLVQEEIDTQFPDFPPLLEIERNQSLTLMNSHFSMDMTYPLLPSQKEVGAMHCRPAKPLPEKMRSLCLLLLVLGWTAGELPPPERSYKILMVLPVSSISHRNVFLPLAKALAERGHKIEMLSNTDKPLNQPGIREISHNLPEFNVASMNMFETRKERDGVFYLFIEAMPKLARKLYHLPQVKELYARRKEFDLVISDHMFNEAVYPFAYELPFMTIATPGMDYRQSAVLGNVLNPAYVPNFLLPTSLDTVFGRLKNTFLHIFTAIHWRLWQIVPSVQKEISAQFPDLPPLLDIERNQSLTLLNSHFSMDMPVPLLPSQSEVGGLHCRPAKPLPEDIKSWLDGAGPEGAIYFSLGSVARGDTMPSKYRDMLVEAFKKLNHRILWKFERDLEGISNNVMIKNWLPQQDILAHPNVKMFITHGGLLSLQESCYHGKPVLALPIFGDQEKNAIKAKSAGLGLWLVWEELTVDKIVESIREIIDNPRYSETVASISSSLKDQLNHPLERAIFWTEYVVRHKGAPRLRSPGASLSWVEYLLLDVLALLFLIVVTVLLFIRWTVKKILWAVFTESKPKNAKKKNQ